MPTKVSSWANNRLVAMRQRMGAKVVTISRARGTLTFPANFTLVAAMNPCPCRAQKQRLSWSGCCAWLD
jgi:magnesium chelatase family protein